MRPIWDEEEVYRGYCQGNLPEDLGVDGRIILK
jgi:hypothetical protein